MYLRGVSRGKNITYKKETVFYELINGRCIIFLLQFFCKLFIDYPKLCKIYSEIKIVPLTEKKNFQHFYWLKISSALEIKI